VKAAKPIVSLKRLTAVVFTAVVVAGLPGFYSAFDAPLPHDATWEELRRRFNIGILRSMNSVIPAVLASLVGFFTRADGSKPLLVFVEQSNTASKATGDQV